MKNGLLRTIALVSILLPMSAFATPQQSSASIFDTIPSGVYVQALPPGSTAAQKADAAAAAQGKQYYNQVFQKFLRDMQMLGDPGQAEAFKAEWEHKFDGQLTSRSSVENAVNQLAAAGMRMGCSEVFDGKCLYLRAFRAYMNYHYSLDTEGAPNLSIPADRAKWAAEWEHKFDLTGDLLTEAGTDSAIRKMRNSLGLRFDYVFSAERTKEEADTRKANFGGIGVPVEMSNSGQAILASPMELVIHSPDSGSPAHGIVQNGDVIVNINGKPVLGMTIKDAMSNFVGKPGTVLKLTVRRLNDSGQARLVDVEIKMAYTPNPLSSIVRTGDADAGVPIEITHRDDIKLSAGFDMVAGEPDAGSPSKGKVFAGDVILKVNGEAIYGLTLTQAVDKIRGPKGTSVTLTVRRADDNGKPSLVDVVIPRQVIEQHAVRFRALDNDISYIRLNQFESLNVPKDMAAAIGRAVLPLAAKALAAKTDADSVAMVTSFNDVKKVLDAGGPMKEEYLPIIAQAAMVYDEAGKGGGIILDLRSNPGGDLEVFRNLAAMTLGQGSMMVQVGRTPGTDTIMINEEILTPNFMVLADHPVGGGMDTLNVVETPRIPMLVPSTMPFVVLIDEMSASASELLSGMLQANHRVVVVGKSSLGKGNGQVSVQLPYGRSLHVTNFEFYPGGMKADWIGVIVDVDVTAATDGKTDTQLDAAVAEIQTLIKKQATRAAAVEAALKKHHQYFDANMQDRADEDNKPVGKQDPWKLH